MMATATKGVRAGFTTVTPYLMVADVDALVRFAKAAFGAVETGRSHGGHGIHCELQIGDSMLMCGGPATKDRERPQALHLQVPDVDATYQRALAAGGESLAAPEEKPYGERMAGVKDPVGNSWYIATHHGPLDEGIRAVTPYLHQADPLALIEFLKQAFQATEMGVYKTPDGRVMHAAVRIGDAVIEMGQTDPMLAGFYMYVPDAGALYQQAIAAGAKSVLAPADQPYGDHMGAVEDPWGNSWAIATHLGPRTA